MSAQQLSRDNAKQHDANVLCQDLELAQADALLDQVETAQQHIRDIQNDISLLQTMENGLGLISENMARIRRLARSAQRGEITGDAIGNVSDEIRNLAMVNMLISEDTEFDGRLLFIDGVLSMSSFLVEELTLTTTRIPEISGVETCDFLAILDGLDNAACVINRQYQRIGTVMRALLDAYQQLRWEINLLMSDRAKGRYSD